MLRDHDLKPKFAGPRFFVRVAGLEMHPLDSADRLEALKNDMGIGFCNIQNVVQKSVLKIFTSLIMQLFHLKRGWLIGFMIH